jgi:hypothetical protein
VCFAHNFFAFRSFRKLNDPTGTFSCNNSVVIMEPSNVLLGNRLHGKNKYYLVKAFSTGSEGSIRELFHKNGPKD